MLYFIAWVLFLLVVALAIPIASFLEKRKYAAAHPQMQEQEQAVFDENAPDGSDALGGSAEAAEAGDGFGEDPAANFDGGEVVEFGEIDATGGDDFSAFDEEFK